MSDAVDMIAALGGELITYRPSGGVATQFRALIEREPSRVAALVGVTYPEQAMLITFARAASGGMLTVQKGKDRVLCKRHVSDSQETEYTVAMVQDQDSGMVSGDQGMYTVLVK